MKKPIGRPKDLGYGTTPMEWLHRVRCLTDRSLLELHEEVFSAGPARRWKQDVPPWAYRVDIERRVAAVLALESCTIPRGHDKRKKRFRKMKRVLRAPIRAIQVPVSPSSGKVNEAQTKLVTPSRNNFNLRRLVAANPGMDWAAFKTKYGRFMPKVTRGSFDTTRWVLRRAGYPVRPLRPSPGIDWTTRGSNRVSRS